MRKFLISNFQFLIISFLIATPVYAQAISPAPTTPAQGRQSVRAADRMADLKVRADVEITRRITSLNNLITRINNIKKLSADSKSALSSEVQTQITNLTNLKNKIDADTDMATLKQDVKSIIDSYRIYALFIPRTHIVVGADLILQVVDKFADVQARLQAKISQAQSSGKDVSTLQAALADIQTKVADAKLQANSAINLVTPLQPSPNPQDYKPTLQQARTMLQSARKDLRDARQDVTIIIQGLRSMRVRTKPSSPSASPS